MHDTCVKIKKNLPNRFHHIKPRVYTKSCAGFTTHCDIGALSQAIQHFSFDISWYADELSFDKTAEVRLLLDLAPCMWSGTIFSADCKTADFPIFRCLFVLPIVKKKKKKTLDDAEETALWCWKCSLCVSCPQKVLIFVYVMKVAMLPFTFTRFMP